MKTTIAILVALAALGSPAFAKKVQLNKLPSEVREVIDSHVKPSQLDDLKIRVNGKGDKYNISLKLKGKGSITLKVSSEGDIIKLVHKLDHKQTPKKVQLTAAMLVQWGLKIEEVRRETKDGKPVFVFTLKNKLGNKVVAVISNKGKILEADIEMQFEDLPEVIKADVELLFEDLFIVVAVDRLIVNNVTTYRVALDTEEGGNSIIRTYDSEGVMIDEVIGDPV